MNQKLLFSSLKIMMFMILVECLSPMSRALSADTAPAPAFESISDVDLSFFLTNPKLPWGVDPFLKEPGFASVQEVGDGNAFTLGGIMYSKNMPMAIVNGKTVKEGDQIGDRSVSSIGDNFVILRKKNSEIELTLPPLNAENEDEDNEDEDE